MFSVRLRSDEANDVHRGMTFIHPVKDIEAMEKEVHILFKKNILYFIAIYNFQTLEGHECTICISILRCSFTVLLQSV